MKRHILTDGRGVPLSALITGANVHDKWMVAQVLDAVPLRTSRGPRRPKHLCLDKGYDYADVEAAVRKRRIIPHIRRRGEQPLVGCTKGKPRRWVVERTFAWLLNDRRHSRDYERLPENSEALIQISMIRLLLKRLA